MATLSIAMIVRDEADFLGECLAQICPLADEICVVDTGSTDETLEIARGAGCRTASFPWRNNFAAARNASLDLCSGDWIFVLDADERLAEQDFDGFRDLLAYPRDRAFRLTTRNYTNNSSVSGYVPSLAAEPLARGFAGWFPSVKVRLFPRHPEVRFEHRIHEVPTPSLVRLGFAIEDASVPVHHYSLLRSEQALRRKQEIYIALGEAKVAEHPGDANAHAELGTQYVEAGDLARAIASLREAVRLDPANGEYLKDLGGALYRNGHKAQAHQAFALAVRHAPELVDAWRNLGVTHAEQGQWREAEACFARAVALAPGHEELQQYLALARERWKGQG